MFTPIPEEMMQLDYSMFQMAWFKHQLDNIVWFFFQVSPWNPHFDVDQVSRGCHDKLRLLHVLQSAIAEYGAEA